MGSESPSRSATRTVRALLLLAAAVAVGYAVSDHPFYGSEPGFGRVQALIAAAGLALALCAWLPHRFASGALILAVTSAIMLALAEFVGEAALGPLHRPIYQPDDRLIFKLIPGRCSAITRTPLNGGDTVRHCINSSGFRGAELLPVGSMPRVVVYGDSFIHAYYSREEETFAAQLARALGERLAKPVEVVNAGVSSYGPDQVALKMERELPQLRPELAVVAVFAGNDYGDLMRNKMFRLGAHGELVDNRWRLDAKVRQWMELSQQESILLRAPRNILASLRAAPDRYEAVMDLDFLLQEAEREYRSFVIERDDVVTNTHVDHYSADVSLTPRSESARHKIALMRAVVARIREVAARNGVPLALLLIPHPLDVTPDYQWGRVERARFPGYDGRNQTAFLEAMARDLGVPCVNLFEVFRAHDPRSLYLRGGDDHWNAAGQRLAAEAMADQVLASGLLRGRNAP